MTWILALFVFAVFMLAPLLSPQKAWAKGGSSTSSTNVSIPPEQWYEAIAREDLYQDAYNKAQQGSTYWNMANQMMGLPTVNYDNPYPTTPTGPFEWTHSEGDGTSWGRGWDGKNLQGPGSSLFSPGGSQQQSSLSGYPSSLYSNPLASGLDPTAYKQVERTGENPATWWTLRDTGNQQKLATGSSDQSYGSTPTNRGNSGTTGGYSTSPAFRGDTSYIPNRPGVTLQQETPAWQQRMNTNLSQDFGQGLMGMDTSLRQANSALGNQGSSLNAATGAYNKAGGYFDQASGAFNQGSQYAADAAGAAKGAQGYFDQSAGVASQMSAPISKLGALGDEMQSTLLQGQLPASYQENWIKGNQRGFDELMGSNLNDLASRGVINSSVANRSLGEVNDRINESYAQNFLNSMAAQRANYDSVAGKYTDQLGGLTSQAGVYDSAGQGYLGSANAFSTAGQTANASGQGLLGAGQGYLGVGQGHLGAASGWGDAFGNYTTNAQNAMLPYQTRISGAQELMGIGDTMNNDLKNLYSMASSHRYGVPGDTVVTQGK